MIGFTPSNLLLNDEASKSFMKRKQPFYVIVFHALDLFIRGEYILSSFSLIQPSFVKLTQLAGFDKTSDAWYYVELVIVRGTGSTEISVAYLGEHQTSNPGTWFQLRSKLWSVVNIFG